MFPPAMFHADGVHEGRTKQPFHLLFEQGVVGPGDQVAAGLDGGVSRCGGIRRILHPGISGQTVRQNHEGQVLGAIVPTHVLIGVRPCAIEPFRGHLKFALIVPQGHAQTDSGVGVDEDLEVADGYEAAKDCAKKILRSVYNTHGTLADLKVIKLLGCVYSDGAFTDQHLVINGCSDLLHQVFGKTGDGYHARSALGFAALPTGAAVEVEAIFEVVT